MDEAHKGFDQVHTDPDTAAPAVGLLGEVGSLEGYIPAVAVVEDCTLAVA